MPTATLLSGPSSIAICCDTTTGGITAFSYSKSAIATITTRSVPDSPLATPPFLTLHTIFIFYWGVNAYDEVTQKGKYNKCNYYNNSNIVFIGSFVFAITILQEKTNAQYVPLHRYPGGGEGLPIKPYHPPSNAAHSKQQGGFNTNEPT